jgi:hypothetical protein
MRLLLKPNVLGSAPTYRGGTHQGSPGGGGFRDMTINLMQRAALG